MNQFTDELASSRMICVIYRLHSWYHRESASFDRKNSDYKESDTPYFLHLYSTPCTSSSNIKTVANTARAIGPDRLTDGRMCRSDDAEKGDGDRTRAMAVDPCPAFF
jgi:hypothetical protein